MIRYHLKSPGGDGIIPTVVRLWWLFINNYHTCRCLLAQSLAHPTQFVLPRNEKRSGETVVITGGSRGVGAEVVKKFLQYDMHVIIGCKSRVRTNNIVSSIRRKGITTGTVEALSLDLTSFNSIREFTYKILKKDVTITVLVNNAGVKDIPYGLTVEGLEHHFQVNYLGHVLLIYMLLPKLHCSAQPTKCSRVVNVSSMEHYGAYPDLSDSQMTNFYSSEKAYMDTKLMQIAFSNFLNEKLEKVGAFVKSYAVHPGFVRTNLWSQVGWVERMGILHHLFFERPESAAGTIAYAALSPHLEGKGGLFLKNNKPIEPHPLCTDEKFQNKLWDITSAYLKLEENCLSSAQDEQAKDNGQAPPNTDINDIIEEFGWTDIRFLDQENVPEKCDSNNGDINSGLLTSCKRYLDLTSCFTWTIFVAKGKSRANMKPYYEYFISSIFRHSNLNKSCLRYLEAISIFVIRSLDMFNSHFKFVQSFVRSD